MHRQAASTLSTIIEKPAVKTRVNCLNKYKHREGKLPGCYFKKDKNKWAAQIQISSKRIFLGYFESELDAHRRYMEELKNNGI
jgi:hypothetical protein